MSLQCNNPLSIKKLLLRVLKVAVILMVVFLLTIWSPWIFMGCMAILEPAPPAPQETYGEFPFKISYEIDNKTVTIEDTLVIEYKGTKWNEGLGKYNHWSRYFKNQRVNGISSDEIILYSGFLDNGNPVTIYFELGSCEYYMGLPEADSYYMYNEIYSGDIVLNAGEHVGCISEDELYNKFGIKVVEKFVSPPLDKE